MGEQWKRLPPSEREPFLKLAAEDSKRYARDKASLTEAWLAIQPNDVREAWLRKKGERPLGRVPMLTTVRAKCVIVV